MLRVVLDFRGICLRGLLSMNYFSTPQWSRQFNVGAFFYYVGLGYLFRDYRPKCSGLRESRPVQLELNLAGLCANWPRLPGECLRQTVPFQRSLQQTGIIDKKTEQYIFWNDQIILLIMNDRIIHNHNNMNNFDK